MQNPFEENAVPVRPTFLTVLCVLTISWNIIGFYNGIHRIVTAEEVAARKDKVESVFDDVISKYSSKESSKEGAEQIEQMQVAVTQMLEPKNIINGGIANIFSSILLILGAVWMLALKKKGFYAYLLGNFVGVLAPIVLMVNQLGWMFGIFSLINAAIFAGLYGLNLKYLS